MEAAAVVGALEDVWRDGRDPLAIGANGEEIACFQDGAAAPGAAFVGAGVEAVTRRGPEPLPGELEIVDAGAQRRRGERRAAARVRTWCERSRGQHAT